MSKSDLFEGYVLAGGKSSRMGTDKAFLKIGEKTFLENAVDALKPNCRSVKAVLNSSQTDFVEKLPAGIEYIFDIHENRGPLGGIHAALKDCKSECAIIVAVDLPFVTSNAIAILLETACGSDEYSAIIPRQNGGKLQPLCAVYRTRKCMITTSDLLEKNESVSVNKFLNQLNIAEIDQSNLSSDENLLRNINSNSDFPS